MRFITMIFFTILLSSCVFRNDLATAQTKETMENENLGSIQIISQGETFWNVDNPQDFGTYSIERISKTKDDDGNFIRPFNKVSVDKIQLKSKPSIGDIVSVIPLELDFQPFELAVIKTEKTIGKNCDRKKESVFWLTELENVTEKIFLM